MSLAGSFGNTQVASNLEDGWYVATILVIDDDDAIADVIMMALEDEGHHVLRSMGAASLDVVRREKPDVIFLDLMMPGMSGVEVAKHLKNDADTQNIPIIVISAANRIREFRHDLPVEGFLAKPFELDELFASVSRFIEG